jgi:hypothetical protein
MSIRPRQFARSRRMIPQLGTATPSVCPAILISAQLYPDQNPRAAWCVFDKPITRIGGADAHISTQDPLNLCTSSIPSGETDKIILLLLNNLQDGDAIRINGNTSTLHDATLGSSVSHPAAAFITGSYLPPITAMPYKDSSNVIMWQFTKGVATTGTGANLEISQDSGGSWQTPTAVILPGFDPEVIQATYAAALTADPILFRIQNNAAGITFVDPRPFPTPQSGDVIL